MCLNPSGSRVVCKSAVRLESPHRLLDARRIEALAGEPAGRLRPCAPRLHERPRPVELRLEPGESDLDELARDSLPLEVVADGRVARAPLGERPPPAPA